VGKTALAVHWARRVADRFPDGQLHLDLRGWSATPPLRPDEALRQLLHALGSDRVPADLDEASRLYRSLSAGRRMLVLLDNAGSAEQVRPLLPGGPGCLVVVTSRDRLAGLLASHGARPLVLDPLPPGEAEGLLGDVVGAERVQAEPEAVGELAHACAHLPLALRIAAANLVGEPHRSIAAQVAELQAGDRLAALEIDGDPHAAVRAAFDASYRRLAAPERRLFRLLGLVPGADLTAAAAAALAAADPATARRELGRLAAAHLVDQYAPGRYRLHDLLRLYAAERARQEAGERERRAATGRLLDFYLSTAEQAARQLYPHHVRLPPPAAGGPPPGTDPSDPAQALEWLDAEGPNLFAAVRHAAEHGHRPLAWRLAHALRGWFWLRIPAGEWGEVAGAALAAAEAEQDLHARAAAELSLGDLHWHQGRSAEAAERYAAALRCAARAGWPEGQAAAVGNLGLAHWRAGRLEQAAGCLGESLTLARASGWSDGHANLLERLGAVHAEAGRLREALDQFTAALALDRDPGPVRAHVLDGLGEICRARGHLDLALGHLAEALATFRRIGCRGGQAGALRNLAAVHCDAGRYDQAVAVAGEALELARRIGSPSLEAGVLNALGATRQRLGDHRAALRRHQRALQVARAAGARYQETEALVGIATAGRHLGALDQAAEHARQALRAARAAGYRVLEGQAGTALAAVELALGRPDQAAEQAEQALAILDEAGAMPEAEALRELLARLPSGAATARR
jgi:tetratricopeptide (TPR) repeat protein